MDNPELQDNNDAQVSAAQDQEQKKLNEIRNLLFGQNVQEYRSEFGELKSIIQENKSESEQSLAEFQSDVLQRLEQLENKINEAMMASNQSITQRLDELDDRKSDRKTIASILHQLASQLEA